MFQDVTNPKEVRGIVDWDGISTALRDQRNHEQSPSQRKMCSMLEKTASFQMDIVYPEGSYKLVLNQTSDLGSFRNHSQFSLNR